MFVRNNQDIDYEALEQDIARRLERHRVKAGAAPQEFAGVHPLHDAKSFRISKPRPTNLQELYELEGEEFISSAFRLLLGRDADHHEQQELVALLNGGFSKSRMAYRLRYGSEGRKHNSDVRLGTERFAFRLIDLPIAGPAFEALLNVLKLGELRRYVEALRVSQLGQIKSQDAKIQSLVARNETSTAITEELQQSTARASRQLEAINNEVTKLSQRADEVSQQLLTLDAVEAKLASLQTRVTIAEQCAVPHPGAPRERPIENLGESDDYQTVRPSPTDDAFYEALESRFRGNTPDVESRLRPHLRHLDSLPEGEVLDLGSGRGEWLSLLKEAGRKAIGVDTSAVNIENCKNLGLTVHHEDALNFLRGLPESSLAMISAFHLIEHLDFPSQRALITQSLRCLKTGGLLLLETPNPENLLVATNSFHYDPTHKKPLPPALAEFMLQYFGFAEVKLERLNPADAAQMLTEPSEVSLRCNHLFYAAQDYAVSGRKPTAN